MKSTIIAPATTPLSTCQPKCVPSGRVAQSRPSTVRRPSETTKTAAITTIARAVRRSSRARTAASSRIATGTCAGRSPAARAIRQVRIAATTKDTLVTAFTGSDHKVASVRSQ